MKKVIVITGGNSGLGKATAKILTKKNQVIILGRNEETVKVAAKNLKCAGLVCDVTDAEQIKKTIKEIVGKYKRIDCLVNCAGVYISGPLEENDPARIKDLFLVNS